MDNNAFSNWCETACLNIVFKPDRKVIAQELREHMDDHYEALIAKGFSQKEAEKMTLDSMGSPYVVARQLLEVHRPIWGYLLRGIRIAIVALLIILVIPGWKFLCAQDFTSATIDDTYYPEDGLSIVCQAPVGATFKDGDYTYTLSKAVIWESSEERRLYFNIDQSSFIPCSATEHYCKYISPAIAFWGVDNLGNYYKSGTRVPENFAICTMRNQKGFFTWRLECWVNDFPEDVEWIDIHYTRDGRDHVIRISLEGGSGK